MSVLDDVDTAIKRELAQPETRRAIEGVEKAVFEVVKNALEALIPSWLHPLIGGLLDGLAEKGITAIEHFTDEKLAGLYVPVVIGQTKVFLVASAFPATPRTSITDTLTGAADTHADWPGPVKDEEEGPF